MSKDCKAGSLCRCSVQPFDFQGKVNFSVPTVPEALELLKPPKPSFWRTLSRSVSSSLLFSSSCALDDCSGGTPVDKLFVCVCLLDGQALSQYRVPEETIVVLESKLPSYVWLTTPLACETYLPNLWHAITCPTGACSTSAKVFQWFALTGGQRKRLVFKDSRRSFFLNALIEFAIKGCICLVPTHLLAEKTAGDNLSFFSFVEAMGLRVPELCGYCNRFVWSCWREGSRCRVCAGEESVISGTTAGVDRPCRESVTGSNEKLWKVQPVESNKGVVLVEQHPDYHEAFQAVSPVFLGTSPTSSPIIGARALVDSRNLVQSLMERTKTLTVSSPVVFAGTSKLVKLALNNEFCAHDRSLYQSSPGGFDAGWDGTQQRLALNIPMTQSSGGILMQQPSPSEGLLFRSPPRSVIQELHYKDLPRKKSGSADEVEAFVEFTSLTATPKADQCNVQSSRPTSSSTVRAEKSSIGSCEPKAASESPQNRSPTPQSPTPLSPPAQSPPPQSPKQEARLSEENKTPAQEVSQSPELQGKKEKVNKSVSIESDDGLKVKVPKKREVKRGSHRSAPSAPISISVGDGTLTPSEVKEDCSSSSHNGSHNPVNKSTDNTARYMKTRMCLQHKLGQCKRGSENCKFAHSLQELVATPDVYKTKICAFWSVGNCKAGPACRHAHGEEELRSRNMQDGNFPGTEKAQKWRHRQPNRNSVRSLVMEHSSSSVETPLIPMNTPPQQQLPGVSSHLLRQPYFPLVDATSPLNGVSGLFGDSSFHEGLMVGSPYHLSNEQVAEGLSQNYGVRAKLVVAGMPVTPQHHQLVWLNINPPPM
eukprot:Blabericola_migrator_1__5945@NODE_2_length_32877_cov_165_790003_g1_i0_p3_GENE_NODE_2_length_32877_cov_165_790003_g1_i0NODE_2_length_32877_cov_165_790003_g1_i0_p3_ORF_typecomplete_len820_score111_99zfCCCH/PF00642_24/7_5e03zfCCCH/PF00642_24/1_8e04zfCCCH/PF00642_24/0_00028zfCCCH/PF00642_24/2_5e06zfCCCH_3/PF15663_5/4e06C1_1/PF00130_22/0_0023zfCCCH_4/PF18044_1/9_8e03zfCCCH_4/PF18044_1/3_2e03zfCCCH_4/PF18044_1/0_47zfCCCH_4/PF18044_1/0_021Torus/PF16131_5/1_8e04Torus/PF16131_5/0_19Torus/PF16131_5/0_025T